MAHLFFNFATIIICLLNQRETIILKPWLFITQVFGVVTSPGRGQQKSRVLNVICKHLLFSDSVSLRRLSHPGLRLEVWPASLQQVDASTTNVRKEKEERNDIKNMFWLLASIGLLDSFCQVEANSWGKRWPSTTANSQRRSALRNRMQARIRF